MTLLALALPLALLGCAPTKEAAPALSASADTLDLGTVGLGTSAEATVTLSNVGGGAVEILSASLVEGDARAWAVAREGFEPLAGGVVTTLTFTFSPDEEGPSPAQVQIRSDDPENASLYVSLAGTGGPSTDDDDGDGHSPAEGDCDDGNADVHPGADEDCDGRDNDCDGVTPSDEVDADGDGYRLCAGSSVEADCDDADPNVHPGAEELCDDKDSDCDGTTPDRADADGDGYSICDEDCDDDDAVARPGGVEVCDGADNDCSGAADDLDADGDGASLCGELPDCDDEDAAAYPVFVDPAVEPGGAGTFADPYATLADALDGLGTCGDVGLLPGTYTESTEVVGADVRLYGLAGDPAGVVFTPEEGERSFVVSDFGSLWLFHLSLFGGRPTEGDGGAILGTEADVLLWNVVVSNNTSPADGGAIAVSSGILTLTQGCILADNVAGDDGGAVALVSSWLFDDADTTWVGNRATQGGALLAVSGRLEIRDSLFEENNASGDGGAIAVEGAAVAVEIERVVFTNNSATGRGGAIALNDVTTEGGYLRNSVVTDNFADEGGGIALTGDASALVLANNTLVGNISAGDGAAILVDATDASGLYVWANIFAWNDGDTGLWAREGNAVSVTYNLGYATNSGTDFSMGADTDDNLVEDPLFVDFSDNGDFSDDDLGLRSSSPGVDSGPPDGAGPGTYTTWADPDGSANDRGHGGGVGGW